MFDKKSDGRYKARIVVKGFSQIEGIDFDEIFSPVVRFETVRLVLALCALEDWHITGLDVKNAFLYGELDEEIYMEQPQGFKAKGQEHKVWRLKKALYGLKQAALAWWKALSESMEVLGFTRLTSDAGIFVCRQKDGSIVIAIIYVDDALFVGANKVQIRKLKAQFMERWECRDLGDNSQEFLRMRIRRELKKIHLDQVSYLDKVLARFGMTNAHSAPTPLPAGFKPIDNKAPVNPELRSEFQSIIGSLLYLMLGTRPDIAYAVTKLSKFAANPSKEHRDKALYICRYLVGTRNYSLVLDGTKNAGLEAFTDSDWGGDLGDRVSITGYFFKLANAAISWTSRTQKSVALSSTEAEYMALSDCSRQAIWIRNLLIEIGYEHFGAVPIAGDNQGSIFIGSNPVQDRRTKHIDIRYHFIRQTIQDGKVELSYIPGAENPADMFTKNLGETLFTKFREHLGLEFYQS